MSRSSSGKSAPAVLTSRDVVAGLGAAPRELLAACLALFDDSTLRRRLGTLVDRFISSNDKEGSRESDADVATSVQGSLREWRESRLSDDSLRVLLWIYLRDALALSPSTFASARSAGTAADDIVARALHSLQPGRLVKFAQQWGLKDPQNLPTTLDALSRKTMEELMASFLDADDEQSVNSRERLLSEVREHIGRLPEEDRNRLLQAVGADDVNDAALRKILLTGGGLGAFGVSVSLAGFSAYILAAQASAFIPLVSGPALVSMVSVLSNPITIVVATAGMGWWATRSASQKVRGAIAVRVLSLLALNGLDSGAKGVRSMIDAFSSLEVRPESAGSLSPKVLGKYRADWRLICAVRQKATVPNDFLVSQMERLASGFGGARRPGRDEAPSVDEYANTAALAGLTLGEVLYNAFNLDPSVLAAADFSRVEDLNDPVAFAAFAHRIESMEPAAHLGAVSNLKGYMAERVVAAQLIAQGHVVEFPETSNQAGWDISVDGTKFQIKDTDLSGLQRHFDHGYDYPVIANSEVAEKLAGRAEGDLPEWADQIHFVEGYSNEVVEHVTQFSLEAGDSMLHPHIPLFTVVLSGIRNVRRMNRNEITGSQAFQEVLLDGGTRAGLAVIGSYVGVGVGLLVFGPAGALVFGSVVPVASQQQSGRVKRALDGFVKDRTYCAWESDARGSLAILLNRLDGAIREKADLLRERAPDESDAAALRYLRWRCEEDVSFLREAWCRLKAIREDSSASVEDLSARTTDWMSTSTLYPSLYQSELVSFLAIFKRRPSTTARLAVGVQDITSKAKNLLGDWLDRLGDNTKKN